MKKVLLCGLGAVGLTYAVKLKQSCDLRILVDKFRLEKFKNSAPIFNHKEQIFEYILSNDNFSPDIIIIATKSYHLEQVLKDIKPFVKNNTIIISLINGISSENTIKEFYPQATVLKSYFVGHSAMRKGNSVTQDGIGTIFIENNDIIKEVFKLASINYSIPDDIDYAMWRKFLLNLISNPTSAILKMTFGELKNNNEFLNFADKILNEAIQIAKAIGIKNHDCLRNEALEFFEKMLDEGKTSMLQDIEANRKTEIDIFSGEIIKLGEKLSISTPYNQVLYDLIKVVESK